MTVFKINTDLELKIYEVEDAYQLFEIVDKNRAYLKEWLPWLDYNTKPEDSKDFIIKGLEKYAGNKAFEAGIWYKNKLVGSIGLHEINWENDSVSIGYWLAQDFQNLGIMTLACKKVMEYCFEELKLKSIKINCATENFKSQAIPKRLGFTNIGIKENAEMLYGKIVDHFIFSMSNEDYKKIIF